MCKLYLSKEGWVLKSSFRSYIIAALLVMLLGGLVLLGFVARDWATASFTDFYILNQYGEARNYPAQLTAGRETTFIIGIVNHEGKPETYQVEAVTINEVLSRLDGIQLSDGEKFEQKLIITPQLPEGKYKLDFLLYIEDQSAVYRSLYLQIEIVP